MEHSAVDSSHFVPRVHRLKLWFTLFLLSSSYSFAFSIAYIYFWPDILQLTISLTSSGSSSGEIVLKGFFILEAIFAISAFAYLQLGSKLDLSPRVYLELISFILALRIIAGIYLGLEFFVSLIPCLIVHSVIYLAAMGKRSPQKPFVQLKNP